MNWRKLFKAIGAVCVGIVIGAGVMRFVYLLLTGNPYAVGATVVFLLACVVGVFYISFD